MQACKSQGADRPCEAMSSEDLKEQEVIFRFDDYFKLINGDLV